MFEKESITKGDCAPLPAPELTALRSLLSLDATISDTINRETTLKVSTRIATDFIIVGASLLKFRTSPLARPIVSLPWYPKPALTRTLHTPKNFPTGLSVK
ncbi:hypothetical protein OGATHE_002281 [Ogataea polymorpha]|uniref:Uncharacterized protein n=1 Tax=Ogataea polymorpha TaxID=460523 RepID=A0A9P8TBX4_9ASCO|nr:hypothetical protein OGATHE_002281 [Ogataea polymorpha]